MGDSFFPGSFFIQACGNSNPKTNPDLVNEMGLRKQCPQWSPRFKDYSVGRLFNCVKENLGNSQQSLLIEIFVFTL